MEYIAILVVLLITSSVVFLPNQWDNVVKPKRKHTNAKYILPTEFWDDVNFVENMIHTMTDDSAKNVFNYLNQMNDKYRRFFMNRTFDERMTHLIEKYNAKINYFHNNKTK